MKLEDFVESGTETADPAKLKSASARVQKETATKGEVVKAKVDKVRQKVEQTATEQEIQPKNAPESAQEATEPKRALNEAKVRLAAAETPTESLTALAAYLGAMFEYLTNAARGNRKPDEEGKGKYEEGFGKRFTKEDQHDGRPSQKVEKEIESINWDDPASLAFEVENPKKLADEIRGELDTMNEQETQMAMKRIELLENEHGRRLKVIASYWNKAIQQGLPENERLVVSIAVGGDGDDIEAIHALDCSDQDLIEANRVFGQRGMNFKAVRKNGRTVLIDEGVARLWASPVLGAERQAFFNEQAKLPRKKDRQETTTPRARTDVRTEKNSQ